MENPFPTDRMSNWLIGGNNEILNDTRQRKLNAWFRELCNVAEIMLGMSYTEFLSQYETFLVLTRLFPFAQPITIIR